MLFWKRNSDRCGGFGDPSIVTRCKHIIRRNINVCFFSSMIIHKPTRRPARLEEQSPEIETSLIPAERAPAAIAQLEVSLGIELEGCEDILSEFKKTEDIIQWLTLTMTDGDPDRIRKTVNRVVKNSGFEARSVVCDCSATIHPLFGNCLECGKILCASGIIVNCSFCGSYRVAHTADDSQPTLEISAKNKLLEYDRDKTVRTTVFDHSTDWATESQNPWRSQSERADALRRMKEQEEVIAAKRKQLKIRLNFDSDMIEIEQEDAQVEIKTIREQEKAAISEKVEQNSRENILSFESIQLLMDLQEAMRKTKRTEKSSRQEIVSCPVSWCMDEGPYLMDEKAMINSFMISLQQPLASLVVSGQEILEIPADLKHAKYVWIHSSTKEPLNKQPSFLPLGSILGCIKITDTAMKPMRLMFPYKCAGSHKPRILKEVVGAVEAERLVKSL